MARGFLSGAMLGLAVSVGAAVGLSVVTGGPVLRNTTPEAAAVDVPAGSEFNGARDDRKASLPASEPVTAPGSSVSKPTAPEPDTLARLDGADTAPGLQPRAGDVDRGLSQPGGEAAATPGVAVQADAPVQAGGQADAPKAPQVEQGLAVSTTPAEPNVQSAAPQAMAPANEDAPGGPAVPEGSISSVPDQPQAPPADTEDSAFAPAPASEPTPEPSSTATTDAEPAPEPDVASAPSPSVQVDAPAGPLAPQIEDTTGIAAKPAATDSVATPAASAAPAQPEAQETPVIVVQPEPPKPSENAAITPEPQPRAEAEPEPRQPQAEDTTEATAGSDQVAAIRIGKPASNLKQLGTGVQTGRLPSLARGDDTTTGQVVAGAQGDPGEPGARAATTGTAMRPVERFAVPFQGDENKPKMAIVLIDEGKGPVGVEALSTFPYPLSIAVDAGRADAADVMASYRAAGFEVLAMVRLEKGSTPSDVEVAMPVLLANVPEAVAVMEAPDDGIQFDRKVSDQVARILGDTGHGLLLFPKGLNTAQKLAAKNGVPSSTIFRDVDGKGQKASAIRRFLNYGALNAGNEGGVIMVGRLRADTVTALLLWGLEDRARQISLAPVSQLLSINP